MKTIIILLIAISTFSCYSKEVNPMIEIFTNVDKQDFYMNDSMIINTDIKNTSDSDIYICVDRFKLAPRFFNGNDELNSIYGLIFSQSSDYPKESFYLIKKNETLRFTFNYVLINDSIEFKTPKYKGLMFFQEDFDQFVILKDIKEIQIRTIYECSNDMKMSFFKVLPKFMYKIMALPTLWWENRKYDRFEA